LKQFLIPKGKVKHIKSGDPLGHDLMRHNALGNFEALRIENHLRSKRVVKFFKV
jgi:hypothetical protein